MFYYRPPKSSIWGHRLGKMPAERAKALFNQFLAIAVAEYKYSYGSMSIHDSTGQMQSRYERLIGKPLTLDRRSDMLTQEQCEKCVDEFIMDQNAGGPTPFLLHYSIDITQWRLHGQPAPTQSSLSIYYGPFPCLSTSLRFETREQFEYIKQVFADIRLCKLNEKHLREVSPKKKKE